MDNTPILTSTLFLTLLSLIGLVFFIRSSVKERNSFLQCPIDSTQSDRLSELKNYFNQRAYQIILVNAKGQEMLLQGRVRPSLFLAIFLILLAALGLLCLILVIGVLFPALTQISLYSLILSPLAGLFYWQKAGRIEQILVVVKPPNSSTEKSLLTIRGHRDELKKLQQNFDWQWLGQNQH